MDGSRVGSSERRVLGGGGAIRGDPFNQREEIAG
ncbi:hypothetical protein TNIN_196761, partial [Trichonephila inaurata madagascariensis]